MIPRSSPDFVDWLAARHAAVEGLRAEHVREYGGLLPHVLFGDVTRHAADLARRATTSPAAAQDLQRRLRDLDDAIRQDVGGDVENVIWVSFVENASGIPGDSEEPLREEIRRFPGLAHALMHYE